jgi:carboxyl-terminal processing protease
MKSRALIVVLVLLLASILITGACSAGFVAGRWLLPNNPTSVVNVPIPVLPGIGSTDNGEQASQEAGTPEDLKELYAPFWQAWDLVHDQYVDQPVDDEALMRGAIDGMMNALGDEHSSYLSPEMFAHSQEVLNGSEYEGIGAWVDIRSDYLTIINPMPGSPAEKAGLKPGDQVIAVDGEDMTGVDGESVLQRVLGPEGTTVRLTIQREDTPEPIEVTIERAKIVVPTLESRILENNIGYVRLYTFGTDTGRDLQNALGDLMDQNPSGLILDLRGNGGGYLNTAIEVASEFIPDGVVMIEQFGDGRRRTYEAQRGGLATDVPLVVLINEGSASASEIVAGAIQDRGRGQLVGVTSYGKGSVQTYTELVNGDGAVRVTIARWLTPNGNTIHEVGLTPDVVVEMTEADVEAGNDVQLDRAVELLSQ